MLDVTDIPEAAPWSDQRSTSETFGPFRLRRYTDRSGRSSNLYWLWEFHLPGGITGDLGVGYDPCHVTGRPGPDPGYWYYTGTLTAPEGHLLAYWLDCGLSAPQLRRELRDTVWVDCRLAIGDLSEDGPLWRRTGPRGTP